MKMNRIPIAENLFLDEYIPKELYLKYAKTPWILIGFIDGRLIKADQALRNVFGVVTINNWWSGGAREWSGIRTAQSPFYSPTSQHTFGRASDKLFERYSAEEVREYIKLNWRTLGITCIEVGVSWVHSDIRWINDFKNELLLVHP